MKTKTIYILHKNGANNHYLGLSYLCKDKNIRLVFREFSVISKLTKSITKLDLKLFLKQFKNLTFLIKLIFSKNKKIVLGIAPYDPKLKRLLWVLNKHQIYYHTSWPVWDQSFQPKKLKKNYEPVLKTWKNFLEHRCKHIFTVTETAKINLSNNYSLETSKISTVYHSIANEYLDSKPLKNNNRLENSYIYIGRLTHDKGIEELLNIFYQDEKKSLTIIGDGQLKDLVVENSTKHNNITYIRFLKNKSLLANYLQQNSFLILNSKKSKKWEELFGMVIIEAMSQGTIPIAANHVGPEEIINNRNGFIFKEGKLEEKIKDIDKYQFPITEMRKNGIKFSKRFTEKENAKRWQKILA